MSKKSYGPCTAQLEETREYQEAERSITTRIALAENEFERVLVDHGVPSKAAPSDVKSAVELGKLRRGGQVTVDAYRQLKAAKDAGSADEAEAVVAEFSVALGVAAPQSTKTIRLSAFSHFLPPTSPSSGSARSSVLQLESEYNTAAEATRLRVDAAAIAMEARDRIAQELVTARRAADLEHAQRKN